MLEEWRGRGMMLAQPDQVMSMVGGMVDMGRGSDLKLQPLKWLAREHRVPLNLSTSLLDARSSRVVPTDL